MAMAKKKAAVTTVTRPASRKKAASTWNGVAYINAPPGSFEAAEALLSYLDKLGRKADDAKVFVGPDLNGDPHFYIVHK
jgi:hypothetical protein